MPLAMETDYELCFMLHISDIAGLDQIQLAWVAK